MDIDKYSERRVKEILSTKLFKMSLLGKEIQVSRFKLVDFVREKSTLTNDELLKVKQRIFEIRLQVIDFLNGFTKEPLSDEEQEKFKNVFYTKELNRIKIFRDNRIDDIRIDRFFSGASPSFPENLIPIIINNYRNFLALTILD